MDILESKEFYDLMQIYRTTGHVNQDMVVTAFNNIKEYIKNNQREQRVYFLPRKSFDLNPIEIDTWNDSDKLPENARKFITIAEIEGNVYSLKGLMNNVNFIHDIDIHKHLIFITDKY